MFNPAKVVRIDFQDNDVSSAELEFKAKNVYERAGEHRREAGLCHVLQENIADETCSEDAETRPK